MCKFKSADAYVTEGVASTHNAAARTRQLAFEDEVTVERDFNILGTAVRVNARLVVILKHVS